MIVTGDYMITTGGYAFSIMLIFCVIVFLMVLIDNYILWFRIGPMHSPIPPFTSFFFHLSAFLLLFLLFPLLFSFSSSSSSCSTSYDLPPSETGSAESDSRAVQQLRIAFLDDFCPPSPFVTLFNVTSTTLRNASLNPSPPLSVT